MQFTYKPGKSQSNSQPNLKRRRQKAQEAGNAITGKPAGQSGKGDGMTQQAAEQRRSAEGAELVGSLGEARYPMCGEGGHKNEARLIIHARVLVLR